jgi:tetratricopeptide (TPR) repeat protein
MDDFTRSLYALSILGIVAPENRLRKIALVGPPAHEKASEDAQLESGSAKREEHQPEREELMQAYLDHRRMNPFQLLNIPQKAPPLVIQRQYLLFARKYAPWSLEGTELEPLTLRARELFLAGAIAYAQLADGRERELLKRKLKSERVKQESRFTENGKFDQAALLDPEVEYQKARILMEDGNYEEAIKYLESAAEYDPQSGLYRAALAFCWYHIDPESTARQAIADLKRATRIDPGCGVAFLYLGEIYRKLENWEDSERALRKASKLMPTDRRPIDSLKVVSASRREQQQKEAKQTGSLRHKLTTWRERRELKEEEAAKRSTIRKRMSSWNESND